MRLVGRPVKRALAVCAAKRVRQGGVVELGFAGSLVVIGLAS
jgi:hypothetical protein